MHKSVSRLSVLALLAMALMILVGAVATNVAAAPPSDYEIVQSSVLNFSDGGWAGWSCPAGKVVLGGGVEGVKTRTSRPAGPNSVWPHYTFGADEYGWVVRAAEAGPATIWVVCADAPSGYQLVESSGFNFNGAGGWAGWSCPAGKVVLGGGVENLLARTSRPAGPNSVWPHYTFGADEYGWVAQDGGEATTGSKIAIICSDPLPGYQIVESNPLNFGPTGAAGWSCPADTFVTGGGVQNLIASNSRPAGPGTVTDFGYTFGPTEYGWLANNGENVGTSGSRIVPICVEALATGTIVIVKVADPQDGTDFPFTIDPDAMPILYREIFPLGTYAVTQGARLNALDEGWRGYWDGRTTDDGNPAPQNNTSLQIFGPGSTAQVPVNSNPVNAGQGNAFWSPSESRVILYTEEFSFPRADLTSISYETRHNDGDQPQQDFPLLKIDGKWYSPDCQYVNTDVAGNATWIPASWLVNSVTWMELDIDPATNRAVVPGQDCVQTGDFDPPLQTGLTFASLGTTIEAFGLYLPDPESNPQANMRFDNYTFYGAPTGDFTLDDANPDDNDGITSEQVFVTPVGTYNVTELVPQGWSLVDIACVEDGEDGIDNTTTQDSTASIMLEDGETVTCTFTNRELSISGFCPVDDAAVGFEMTDLIGRGMGSPTKAFKRTKLVVPNAGDLTGLYGQLAAVDIGIMKWVRFSDGSSIQINAPTSPAYQTWAVDWWGTELTPGSPIKGAFFTGPRAAKAPRGMVLWPTYETETEYANVFTTFDDSLTNHVYWNTAEGWVNEVVQIVDIPETQAAGADITVKVALVDNQPDDRPVVLTVTPLPGGTPQTLVLFGPNVPGKPTAWQNTLNLETILLENVPAGVNQIEIKLFSPDPYDQGYETGPNGGDSVAMIGAAANYLCDEEVLDGFVNVAIDVFNR